MLSYTDLLYLIMIVRKDSRRNSFLVHRFLSLVSHHSMIFVEASLAKTMHCDLTVGLTTLENQSFVLLVVKFW